MKCLYNTITLLLSVSVAAVAVHDYRPPPKLIAALEIDRQLGASKSSKYKVFSKAKENKSKGSKSKSSTASHSRQTTKSAKSSVTNLDMDSPDSNRPKSSSQDNFPASDLTIPPGSLATEVPSQENSDDNNGNYSGLRPLVFTKGSKSKGSKSKSSTASHSRQTTKSAKSSVTNFDIDTDSSDFNRPKSSSQDNFSSSDLTIPPGSLATEVPNQENSDDNNGNYSGLRPLVFTKGSKSKGSKSKSSTASHSRQTTKSAKSSVTNFDIDSSDTDKSKSTSIENSSSKGILSDSNG
eukprot:scaffold9904_cov137-Skeletonema_menzelii.AAC.2